MFSFGMILYRLGVRCVSRPLDTTFLYSVTTVFVEVSGQPKIIVQISYDIHQHGIFANEEKLSVSTQYTEIKVKRALHSMLVCCHRLGASGGILRGTEALGNFGGRRSANPSEPP
jgi:hypothetical protein